MLIGRERMSEYRKLPACGARFRVPGTRVAAAAGLDYKYKYLARAVDSGPPAGHRGGAGKTQL